jgi:hypothetical protein
VPLGVPGVHPQQVGGEQGRFLAALAGLDLDDHVLGVVRVPRDQQLGQPLFQHWQRAGQRLRLGRERGVLGGELAGRGKILPRLVQFAGRLVDRDQLGEPPADPPGGVLVGVDRRVGEPLLQVRVLVEERGQPLTAHLPAPSPSTRTCLTEISSDGNQRRTARRLGHRSNPAGLGPDTTRRLGHRSDPRRGWRPGDPRRDQA